MLIFLASISFVLFVYPYVIYPTLLKFLPRVGIHKIQSKHALKYALFFSAYNEEAQISRTLSWLHELKIQWPDLEIFAVDDCSNDNTASIIERADHVNLIRNQARIGKPAGLRKLILQSDADIGIFIDANVIADVATISNFKDYFQDSSIGCVGAKLSYFDAENVNAKVGSIYWRLEELIKKRESKTGNTMGVDGSMFATRLANYPQFPDDNADDFRVSMDCLFHGMRCISADDIFVYEDSASNLCDEINRKKRIACGAMAAHRDMRKGFRALAKVDRFKYNSHRLMRWNGALFLWLFVVCAIGSFSRTEYIFHAMGIAALLFAIVFTVPKLRHIGAKVLNILVAIHAVQWGIFENLFGKSYKSWSPPKRQQIIDEQL